MEKQNYCKNKWNSVKQMNIRCVAYSFTAFSYTTISKWVIITSGRTDIDFLMGDILESRVDDKKPIYL